MIGVTVDALRSPTFAPQVRHLNATADAPALAPSYSGLTGARAAPGNGRPVSARPASAAQPQHGQHQVRGGQARER